MTAVRFSFGKDEIVRTDSRCLCLRDANGADLLIYPGFVLMRGNTRGLGVVDCREIELSFEPVRFVASEGVPPDAAIVGQTWERANKDGSPDRRFRDNRRIPIVLCGGFTFESPTGIHEQYLISNCATAERFARAFHTYQQALRVPPGRDHYCPGEFRPLRAGEA
jgi:hypothetical protein